MNQEQFPVLDAKIDTSEIIHNDVVLPSQYFAEHKAPSPEMRLVSAILVDAINCLLGKNKHRKGQALVWFTDRAGGPFTYLDCCQWLSIHPEPFWGRIRTLMDEGRQIKRVNGHLVEYKSMKPFRWRE